MDKKVNVKAILDALDDDDNDDYVYPSFENDENENDDDNDNDLINDYEIPSMEIEDIPLDPSIKTR
jgi:hypothetical protein